MAQPIHVKLAWLGLVFFNSSYLISAASTSICLMCKFVSLATFSMVIPSISISMADPVVLSPGSVVVI